MEPDRVGSLLDTHPTLIAFALLAAGVICAPHGAPGALAWSQVLLGLSLGALLWGLLHSSGRLLWIAAAPLFFLAGFNWALDVPDLPAKRTDSREITSVYATVAKTLSSCPESRVILVADGVASGTTRLPGYGRLRIRGRGALPAAGDRIAFLTRIRTPRNRGNPGEFDWELYCRSRGIFWLASVRDARSILIVSRGSPWSPGGMAFRLRNAVTRFLEDHSKGEERAVLKGIVVGDRGEIGQSVRKAFADSGLAHLLSASGLHVGFVALSAFLLVSLAVRLAPSLLLRAPYIKYAAGLSIPFILAYCMLVGARVPAQRAAVMGIVFAAGILLERRWHSMNSLALAGLIILFLNPLSLYTISFQLSFAAVFGILFVVPRSGRLWEWRKGAGISASPLSRAALWTGRYVLGLFITTAAASAAVSPILLAAFHSLPKYGLLANLAAVPLLMPALCLGLCGSLLGLASPPLGAWVLEAAARLVAWIISVARFFSSLPSSTLRVTDPGPVTLILSAVAGLAVLLLLRRPTSRRLMFSAASVVVAALGILVPPLLDSGGKDLQVVFLNVGKADAAFLQPPGTEGMLIDTGVRTPYFDAGRSILIPFLSRRGVGSLSCVLVSHPQMDHMGGLLSLMHEIRPSRILWNGSVPCPPFMTRILSKADSSGVEVGLADRRTPPIDLGPCSVRFLNAPSEKLGRPRTPSEINNATVVCRVDYGRVSFLFTGDLERAGEAELLRSAAPLRATVLKVPHHGCRTSSSLAFLESVRPKVAVISCSYRAGPCPDRGVMERLESLGCRVFWTGRDGAVTVTTDGKSLRVETGRSSGSFDPAITPSK